MAHDVIEIDAATGIVVERDFTPEELAQRESDIAAAQAAAAEAAEKAAADSAARAAAIAHAKSLGFTDEMIAVMYPSIVA
jgi:hypothetical protein